MHNLQLFSLTCGSKIDKPSIYKTYFPLPFDKYVVFSSQNKVPAKDYSLWQDCINLLIPHLEKESIKIIQLGEQNPITYQNVINLCGRTLYGQTAYLIDKSLLYFGVDGLECQMAGVENKSIVSINSITYAQNNGPYFGDKDKQMVFESFLRTENKKPSFNVQENPKSINLINPEEIANAILEKLNINYKIPFQTVFKGEKYSHFTVQESIPNHKKVMFNPEAIVEIRADYEYNEECLIFQLSQYKKSVLVIDKPINLNILKKFKRHIQSVIFKITGPDHADFIKQLREVGIGFVLISELPQEKINKLKIKYYTYGNINKINHISAEKIDELKKDLPALYYKSAKVTASREKMYYSYAASQIDVPYTTNFEYQKVIDSPLFWANLEFYTIVKNNS